MTKSKHQGSLCNCFRPDPFNPANKRENRFIKRSTPFGEINLIYLQNFVGVITLDQEYPPFSQFNSNSSTRCTPGECDEEKRRDVFKGNLNDTMWNILPALNTTHAFINLGWEHKAGFSAQSEFSCSMQEFEKHYPYIKLFLISHPPTLENVQNPSVSFNATKLKCEIKVLDRTRTNKNAPKSWYWDNHHVLSILNEEYNHQMVKKICPI